MRLRQSYDTIRLVLGDQLNQQHSWFDQTDNKVLYVIAELKQESTYVKHHVQKICAFFSAMANFAEQLVEDGHYVTYLTLDDTADFKDLPELIYHLVDKYKAKTFEYQYPDEYRLEQQLEQLNLPNDTTLNGVESEHFFLSRKELGSYFEKQKHQKMEFFYRKLRKRFDILMKGDKPEGDNWNFDSDNRNKLKEKDLADIPAPVVFTNDVKDILKRLKKHKVATFGKETEALIWPTTRLQALKVLRHFCSKDLVQFGQFQDAMTHKSEHKWSLYHSRLSFALNTKMISPKEVIEKAIDSFRDNKAISLAQIEGFVRQILGWREYIRGVYWLNMPDYANLNKLNARRHLPDFFWDGETRMRCLSEAINQSLEYAYAHHIQRLMVTGNFCLLAGIKPDQVDEWYLGIYIDAIEWVELPNTRGMTQFADGGLVATKPYAASGNYINKMSDYCGSCHYKVKEKTGEDACPLNSMYWQFMVKHRELLEKNRRIGMIFRTWDKQTPDQKQAVTDRADWCLENLDKL